MPKQKFQVTGHLQLAGINGSATSGSVRTVIEAHNQHEAEEKMREYLRRKAQPVISSCRATTGDDLTDLFRGIFPKL